MILESPRLWLIAATPMMLEAALESDKALGKILEATCAEQWSAFGNEIFKFVLERYEENPENQQWWTFFPIIKANHTLIGTCGYKGPPSEAHMVEIGYEVAPDFRGQGFATEIAGILVENARKDKAVQAVLAHTLPVENASAAVLRKVGFERNGEMNDPEEGLVWKWKISYCCE